MDRALEVFAESGTRMSLRTLAAEVGISHGTLLHYFASVDALLLEVVAANDQRSAETPVVRDASTLLEELVGAARRNVSIRGLISAYTALLAASVEPGNEMAHA